MKIRDIITEQQGVAQGTVPGAAPRGRGRPPGTGHPLDHIDNRDDGLPRIGRVEKTATGLKHHARPERGGVIPTADRLATLDKSTTNRLDQVFGVKWPKEKKKQGSIDLTALDSDQQTVAEGSGFDQEAGIGIDGKSFKFKIRDLVALANNYPVTKIDPQQFSKQIAGRDEDSTQSMARAEKADLQYPIIVVKRQNGQLWIADGTHRAHKAILNKLPSINAKIIPIKDMAPFDVEKGVAEGSEMDEALVHRGHVYKRDPDDVWHVRDDNTRKLRHHRGTVILAQARPRIYQDDWQTSYYYSPDPRGRRRRSPPAFHWAYIQGRMVKGLPQDISQGRKLWYQRHQGFVYADSQEPFAAADYVAFNPDGSVVAYDSSGPAPAAGPVVSVEPAQQTVAEGRQSYKNQQRRSQMSTELMRSYLDRLNEQQGVSEGQASLNNRDPQEAALAAALQKIADYAGNRVAKGIGDRYDREVARVFGRIAQAVSAGQYDKAQRILFQQDTVVGDELAAIGVRLKPAATRILGIEWNN